METIYFVLCRDYSSHVYCTTDPEKAQNERINRIENEEMQGGRPLVYIRRTSLIK
jgi:hypothetical protein